MTANEFNERVRRLFREHETLIITDVKPSHIHAALLLIGLTPGESGGEAYLHEVYIAPYEHGSYANLEPRRVRKLLLNRREIQRLSLRTRDAGWTLVPLSTNSTSACTSSAEASVVLAYRITPSKGARVLRFSEPATSRYVSVMPRGPKTGCNWLKRSAGW